MCKALGSIPSIEYKKFIYIIYKRDTHTHTHIDIVEVFMFHLPSRVPTSVPHHQLL
jgi:hypothetical protein